MANGVLFPVPATGVVGVATRRRTQRAELRQSERVRDGFVRIDET